MSKVRFSVNVPVYNAEKYLHECIDSILNQTFTDFELLLVDDGSKDSSGAICDEYAKKDNRIRVFHNENQGSFATRVFSVSQATGEYCMFCDSDDYFDADYLKRTNEIINENNCDLAVFCLRGVGASAPDTVRKCWDTIKVFSTEEEKKEFISTMMNTTFFNSISTKVIKTQLLKDDTLDMQKYSFVKSGDDFLQSLYPVFNADKIVFVPESYYNYRLNPESLTHRIDPNIYNSIFAVRSVIWSYIDGMGVYGDDDKRVFAMYSARTAMKMVKSIALMETLTDEEKTEHFHKLRNHEFYRDFIVPNLVKTDLDKKWQIIYELFSRHSYKLLLSAVKVFGKIKNNSR